jgi:DNA-binding transcriptional regulator YiaG
MKLRRSALDVFAIRRKTGRSQAEFARLIGVRVVTVASWEQDRRRPSRIARRMLELIWRSPDVIRRLDELLAAKREEMMLAVDRESD